MKKFASNGSAVHHHNMWAKKIAMSLGFLIFSWSNAAHAVTEEMLPELYSSHIQPYFLSSQAGEFTGVKGVPIRYRVFRADHERGALVILTGRSEFTAKYAEVLYDLRDAGYSLYIMDHRGQGTSGRMLKNPLKGYVRHFNDYVADFGTFMDQVVNSTHHDRTFLLAHSMGGAIGTLYAIEHPQAFTAIALSSPMYEVQTLGLPEWLAYTAIKAETLAGFGTAYAPERGEAELQTPFEENSVTFSRARYDLAKQQLTAEPSLSIAGPTCRWLQESIEADWDIRSRASLLSPPTLLFQAGVDLVVKTEAQNQVCADARQCRVVTFPHAMHELLMEKDEVRSQVLSATLSFFSQY